MREYSKKIIFFSILVVTLYSCTDNADKSSPQNAQGKNAVDWSSPAGVRSVSPNLSSDLLGRPILSWIQLDGDHAALQYARWLDNRWSQPVSVAGGDKWLVNRADFPSVVQLTESIWASHWLVMTDVAQFAYDVRISLSNDGGQSWGEPFSPHTDGTISEHGFVSFFVDGSDLGAVWLDGREMIQGHHHGSPENDSKGSGMTLRSATFDVKGNLANEQVIDNLVCDCCQTDISSAGKGPVLVFRNRTSDEQRDIYFSHRKNGRWSDTRPVSEDNWFIGGCPVNGPSVATSGDVTAVAWFTMANGYGEVKFARSIGATIDYGDPIIIDQGSSVVGQVGLEGLGDGNFMVSWMTASGSGAATLQLVRVDMRGSMGPVVAVSSNLYQRRAGLPQLASVSDGAIMAWTGGDDTHKAVVVAHIPSNDL